MTTGGMEGGGSKPRPVINSSFWTIGVGRPGRRRRRQTGGRKNACGKIVVLEVAQLLSAHWRVSGDHDDLLFGWKLHHLTGCQQRAGRFLSTDHEVSEPWREPMAGVVALRTQFCGGSQGVGDPLGGALVVSGERDS